MICRSRRLRASAGRSDIVTPRRRLTCQIFNLHSSPCQAQYAKILAERVMRVRPSLSASEGALHWLGLDLNLAKRDRVIAEALVAGRRDQIVVLDANAADAGHVHPRLQRDHIAGEQCLRRMADDERRLRMAEADAVARVMWELLGHAVLREAGAYGV